MHFLHSGAGIAVLGTIAGLLYGPEGLGRIIGDAKTKEISEGLHRIAERLNPSNVPKIAKRIITGPFGAVIFVGFLACCIAALCYEAVAIIMAIHFSHRPELAGIGGLAGFLARINRSDNQGRTSDLVWLIKLFVTLVPLPLFFLGAAHQALDLQSESPEGIRRRDAFLASSLGWTVTLYRDLMKNSQPFGQLILAIVGPIIEIFSLLCFLLGQFLALLLAATFFFVVMKLLGFIALVVEPSRLRRVSAAMGVVLFIVTIVFALSQR